MVNKVAEYYLIKCQDKFDAYKYLINHFNVHRQDVGGLPIDTATICALYLFYRRMALLTCVIMVPMVSP